MPVDRHGGYRPGVTIISTPSAQVWVRQTHGGDGRRRGVLGSDPRLDRAWGMHGAVRAGALDTGIEAHSPALTARRQGVVPVDQ